MPKVDDKMMVKITVDGLVVYCTLWSFFDANELTKTEKKDVTRALARGDTYRSGGGAFAVWQIERDK